MTIYRSMGVLTHEKQPVYTFDRPISEIYDTLNVKIPDRWCAAVNQAGEALVTAPDGKTYLGREILINWGDAPAFRWYDGRTDRHTVLEVLCAGSEDGISEED